MDLMALADALLLPQDDLALATVLRSPLFGFSDDDLFAIAWDRGRASLRAALQARRAAEQTRNSPTAAARLDELAQAARRETPFAFYAHAARRRRRAAALSGAARAGSATMRSTNSSISRSTTSGARRRRCRAFLAWLREPRAEVKRDMEIARDEVRVMTVHGAKGLEAPIVILADTMTPPAGPAAAAAACSLRERRRGLGRAQGRRCASRRGGARRWRWPRPSTNIAGCSTSP